MNTEYPVSFSDDWLSAQAESLRRVAFALLRREDLADDAVQDAFVAVLRRNPTAVTRWPAWLATVTRNNAHRVQREGQRRRQLERDGAREESAPAASHALERGELIQLVATLVSELKEPYGETVQLRYYSNLTPREIAKRLGVPIDTVRTRLQRGLEKLREGMNRRGQAEGSDWRLGLVAIMDATSTAASAATASTVGSPAWIAFAVALGVALLAVVLKVLVYPLLAWWGES